RGRRQRLRPAHRRLGGIAQPGAGGRALRTRVEGPAAAWLWRVAGGAVGERLRRAGRLRGRGRLGTAAGPWRHALGRRVRARAAVLGGEERPPGAGLRPALRPARQRPDAIAALRASLLTATPSPACGGSPREAGDGGNLASLPPSALWASSPAGGGRGVGQCRELAPICPSGIF